MNDSPYLTTAEAAVRLRCHVDTIYRLVQSGDLEHIRVGRKILIPEASLERLNGRTPHPQSA